MWCFETYQLFEWNQKYIIISANSEQRTNERKQWGYLQIINSFKNIMLVKWVKWEFEHTLCFIISYRHVTSASNKTNGRKKKKNYKNFNSFKIIFFPHFSSFPMKSCEKCCFEAYLLFEWKKEYIRKQRTNGRRK